jgi:hypothetical protein
MAPNERHPFGIGNMFRHEDTMGKVYERLDDKLVEFIGRQHLFFVGTAPDAPDGHLRAVYP